MTKRIFLLWGVLFLLLSGPLGAVVRVDPTDPRFSEWVERELEAMRSGKRGLVCQSLISRLENASATATIRPITSDESTWHPNDLKGTRSHVVARDTRIRGAIRNQPTNADIFVHPSRVDASLSLYKLGTFVHELAIAADLTDGRFVSDFRQREKRAAFYRNAWLDALGLKPLMVSDRVPTPEYAQAKERGLLTEDNISSFPIVEPIPAESPASTLEPSATPIQSPPNDLEH